MDKYIRKIITATRNHLKPTQVEQYEKEGYNGHHNIEDIIAMIHIAIDFRYPFLQ